VKAPEPLPAEVIAGLERFAGQHAGETLPALLARLQWDCICGYWYFWRGELFHGVERDGYIHT